MSYNFTTLGIPAPCTCDCDARPRHWALEILQIQPYAEKPDIRTRAFPTTITPAYHASSITATMSGIPPSPFFFSQPLRYMKWASYNKPAYFYSIIIGLAGPAMLVTVPPIRRYLGEEPIQKIPMTYPGT